MLRDICIETNWYAGSLDEVEVTRGRKEWYPLMVRELKAFLACSLYMNMKKLPNKNLYWAKLEKIFYCHLIIGLFTKNRYMTFTQCLHITDSTYVENKNPLHFDEMQQC